MTYRAVVFDLDGTLLNTLDDLADAANRMLVRWGYPEHEVDAYRFFVGSGARELVRRILPKRERTDERIVPCLAYFLDDYSRNCNVKTGIYAGIADLLDALEANGLPIAVLTNKPQHAAEQCCEQYLSAWPVARILGQRPGVPVKPHPAGPLEMMLFLDVAAQEILYVGDTDVDMYTAVNAGMFPVGALWGFRPESELRAAGAKALIRYPLELLKLL